MAIISFATKEIEAFYNSGIIPSNAGWQNLSSVVARKLDMLNYAVDIKDLRSPPNNHLKSLKGDLLGLYSIRINNQ